MASRHWTRLARGVLFWTLPALVFSTQNYAAHLQTEHPLGWWRLLRWELPNWYAWGLLAPAVAALTRRARARGGPRALLPHLAAFPLAACVHTALHVTTVWLIDGADGALGPAIAANLRAGIGADLLVYLLIVAMTVARDASRSDRERERAGLELEARLATSQLQLLRTQLHPHFVLNVLNAISGLMARDVHAARQMIARLGELLRAAMQTEDDHEIPLARELEFLRVYLDLQRLRFQDRLAVELRIDPAALEARVPRLLLQPIVENALEHGVAARGAAGRIEVHAGLRNGGLRLEVRDDGPGLAAAPSAERIGLGNTRARLRHLYGDGHRFELGNLPAGGCVVVIEIPQRVDRRAHPEPAHDHARPDRR